MTTVRLGIIGMGNIGRFHADYLLQGQVRRCELKAVCSPSPGKLSKYADAGLSVTSEPLQLLESGQIDAVVLATPHYQHTTLGIEALRRGIHLMVEKPISAHKADAERLIAQHQVHPQCVFAGMFQLRVEPRYLKIKHLLDSGQLGELIRVNWIITDWYRTEAYYASGGWRATWKGEGGGVLLNQCLHNLDILHWLCGMPKQVRSVCQLGRFHDIEVEDDVTALLEYSNGATGVFITSTGEAPGTNRLELAGTLGKVVLEHHQLTFTRNAVCMREFSRNAVIGFSKPESTSEEIPFGNAEAPHAVLMQNFIEAILEGHPLITPGAEGMGALELANAILLSSLEKRSVTIPLDGQAYEKTLNQLIDSSSHRKTVRAVSSEDFEKSFHR